MRETVRMVLFGMAAISCFQMIQNINVNSDMALGYGTIWIVCILLSSFVKTAGKKKGDN